MSFLKGFILSRRSPCPNLVKGYTVQTLLRRCPIELRLQVDARWALVGGNITRSKRGALVNVQGILDSKKGKPGSGMLLVYTHKNNSTEITLDARTRMPPAFKAFMIKYNREHDGNFKFAYTNPRVSMWEFKAKKKGVLLDGRDLRIQGPRGIQWTGQMRHPFNNRLTDIQLQGTVAGMTYLQEGPKTIIIFKVITCCAHIVHIFVPI